MTISRRHRTLLAAVVIASVVTARGVNAFPMSGTFVDSLYAKADLVVAGTLGDTRVGPSVEVELGGHREPGKTHVTDVLVDRVIKGSLASKTVSFSVDVPARTVNNPFIWIAEPKSYNVFFLRESPRGYVPVSPAQPFYLARSTSSPSGTDGIDLVALLIGAVLSDSAASNQDKHSAMLALRFTTSPMAVSALRASLGDRDPMVQCRAAAMLLGKSDPAVMLAVVSRLGNVSVLPKDCAVWLRTALRSDFKDVRGITALRQLAALPEPETRRAAFQALANTQSPTAIADLVQGLFDGDVEVRQLAVRGLASVTGEAERSTTLERFPSDGAPLVVYWLSWARERGIIR